MGKSPYGEGVECIPLGNYTMYYTMYYTNRYNPVTTLLQPLLKLQPCYNGCTTLLQPLKIALKALNIGLYKRFVTTVTTLT